MLLPATSSKERELWEDNQIDPDNLFLFHHRGLLRSYAEQHSECTLHLNALLEYTENRFGTEFAEVDRLCEQGLVTQGYISYLFKPNDLVVSGILGKPAAFVLQEWPEGSELTTNGRIILGCWSFQTDGSGFARRATDLSVSIPHLGSDTMKINHLTAYPLRFASPELQNIIQGQGQKHWELRTATQVTYKGWDIENDQYFVSTPFVSSIYMLTEPSSPMRGS